MPKKINIGFSGITRNTDDELSKDGECLELINARIKDGSIQPIGNPILLASLTKKYKAGYYHALADKYLLIRSEDGGVDAYSSDFSTFSILSTDIKDVDNIEIVGNVVSLLKNDGIEYCLYTDTAYKYLGAKPQIPTMRINNTYDSEIVVTESAYYTSSDQSGYNIDLDINRVGYGFFDECISRLGKKGFFVDRTLLRFGLRLFDGNYIYVSPMFLAQNNGTMNATFTYSGSFNGQTISNYSKTVSMSIGKMPMISVMQDFVDATNSWLIKQIFNKASVFGFIMMGFKPTVTFSNLNLTSWRDLIVGIDLFASCSIMDNELKEFGLNSTSSVNTNKSGTSGKYYAYYPKTIKNISNNICDEGKFYKIAEYDIDGNILQSVEDVTPSSLSLEKVLEEDTFSYLKYASGTSYTYNSRLHLGNIKTYYSKGFEANYLSPYESYAVYLGAINTYVNTDNGVVIVKQNAYIPEKIAPLIMYPDKRAFKMVFIRNGKRKEFKLTGHKYLNIATSISYTDSSGNITSRGETASNAGGGFIALDTASWPTGTDDIVEQNTILYRPNLVKVSTLNNPFIFPSKTTYQPSTRKVVGMCSNTAALSQGQFGEHPLYVFCEDGIYAMTVGTDVVYATSKPLNRFVMNGSLRGLDQAVVFSTEQGVMLMSGVEVQNISTDINGYLPSSVDSSPIIPKIMKVAGLDGCLSSAEFKDYVTGSQIGFNYHEREIIISNPSYPYSYVFSMNTKTWAKISMKIAGYINAYPDILAMVTDSTTKIYNMENNHRSVSKIALITRPVKMGTTTMKRILQTALRAAIKRSLSDLYLRGEPVKFRGDDLTIFSDVGFYVLGSNDAEHFTLISGKEKMIDIRDLVTKMNKSKPYKYFMFCLVGGVRTDVALNFVECTVDESFTNRLR